MCIRDRIGAVRRGQWMRLPEGEVEVAGHVLGDEEYSLSLVPRDKDSSRALPGNDLVVSLSLEITEELELEGLARDLVRQVQEAVSYTHLDVYKRQELDLPGRADIERYGIARFNEYCRASVLRYTSEWERYVTRQARWVDFAHDYKTMDLSYMESVMWAFRQLYEKGLLYEGFRVLPYCLSLIHI